MKYSKQVSLQTHNSFSVHSLCPVMFFPENEEDLCQLTKVLPKSFYILGVGSNSLFVGGESPVIIKPNFRGIKITETLENYIVQVGCSENWHQLVCFCIERGINGLENLALIPGSVGAAPVQNIGAYGVELADFCTSVKWFDFATDKLQLINAEECKFAYRESIFKHSLKNTGIITEVELTFSKSWQPILTYPGLNKLPANVSTQEVMQKVIGLRTSKLPDPEHKPNAGSFFKNPVVDLNFFKLLSDKFGEMPHYPQKNGNIKLAAGWLIDQAGLKGIRQGGVGVHDKQALVLVNFESKKGQDIVNLAAYVQQKVFEKFNIKLRPEVRIVLSEGEVNFQTNDLITSGCS